MNTSKRITAICAVTGGALWIGACLYRSTLPRGCVGEECLSHSMRGDTPIGTALFAVAAALILAAGSGLLIDLRRGQRLGWPGRVGLASCLVGLALLMAGGIATAAADGDFALMPVFVLPSVALIVIGVVSAGIAVIKARVVPWWAGASLVVAAGVLLFSNEQTEAVLFAVPFGIAWIIVGAGLPFSTRQPEEQQRRARRQHRDGDLRGTGASA